MAHFNYLKCINGVPQDPMEVAPDLASAPEGPGVTWEKYDTAHMSPKTMSRVLVGGKPVEDPTRRTEWDAIVAEEARVTAAHVSFTRRLLEEELAR